LSRSFPAAFIHPARTPGHSTATRHEPEHAGVRDPAISSRQSRHASQPRRTISHAPSRFFNRQPGPTFNARGDMGSHRRRILSSLYPRPAHPPRPARPPRARRHRRIPIDQIPAKTHPRLHSIRLQ
jgi:hypothetical protein